MAHASSKSFGPGQQDRGKGDGSGGMTPEELESPLPREILSNRDTSRHSQQRGLDSAHIRAQQRQGHEEDEGPPPPAPEPDEP